MICFTLVTKSVTFMSDIHFFSDLFNQNSFSRGVVIKFRDEKESKDFCDSFEEWTKDAVTKGASLKLLCVFMFFFQKKKKVVDAFDLYISDVYGHLLHDS